LAVIKAEVATPNTLVTAVFTPPAKVRLPDTAGGVKVTVWPLTGLFVVTSVTVTTRGDPNGVLRHVVCGEPLVAVIVKVELPVTVTFAMTSGMVDVLAWITAEPGPTPFTGTLMLVVPAGMTTVAGTVAAPGLLELMLTVKPPAGAVPDSSRNSCCVLPPATVRLVGEKLTVKPVVTT